MTSQAGPGTEAFGGDCVQSTGGRDEVRALTRSRPPHTLWTMRSIKPALVLRVRSKFLRRPGPAWFDALESLALNSGGDSGGRRFTREALHDRRGVGD